jgi:hypothetical protein
MITPLKMDTFNMGEVSSIVACRLTGSSAQVKTNAQETENRAQ